MNALIRKANSLYKVISSNISIRKEYKNEVTTRINNNQIAILNTSLGTSNLGDEIIMFYIKRNISEYLQGYDIIEVSTHLYPTKEQVENCWTPNMYLFMVQIFYHQEWNFILAGNLMNALFIYIM